MQPKNSDFNFGPETVKKVADLARMQLSDSELEKFTDQLEKILGYIEQLKPVDTSGVAPMSHPFDLETPLRSDNVQPSLGSEAVLASAPDSLYENFKVPQVI